MPQSNCVGQGSYFKFARLGKMSFFRLARGTWQNIYSSICCFHGLEYFFSSGRHTALHGARGAGGRHHIPVRRLPPHRHVRLQSGAVGDVQPLYRSHQPCESQPIFSHRFHMCCPRDCVSRTANVERNGGHKWVKIAVRTVRRPMIINLFWVTLILSLSRRGISVLAV